MGSGAPPQHNRQRRLSELAKARFCSGFVFCFLVLNCCRRIDVSNEGGTTECSLMVVDGWPGTIASQGGRRRNATVPSSIGTIWIQSCAAHVTTERFTLRPGARSSINRPFPDLRGKSSGNRGVPLSQLPISSMLQQVRQCRTLDSRPAILDEAIARTKKQKTEPDQILPFVVESRLIHR